jgi:hypothetical protein
MTSTLYFEIAGFRFTMRYDSAYQMAVEDSVYLPFMVADEKKAHIVNIDITLTLEPQPLTEGFEKRFDAGDSWALYEAGNGYCMTLRAPTFHESLWTAMISRDFTDITIYVSERLTRKENGKITIINPSQYPLDQIVLFCLLSLRNGALIHAAGASINGQAYLFAGKSGAGKSTLCRQFAQIASHEMFSDDRMAVRIIDGLFRAYGTPWPGDARIAGNASAPLGGVLFLIHGAENAIKSLTPDKALNRLLPVTSIPWFDKDMTLSALAFCDELIARIPCYEFYFKPDKTAVYFLEKTFST